MPTGTIKKLVADRGFGFIAAEDGKEFFFHRSGTEGDFDSLQGGEKVSFEVEASPKGPRAVSPHVVPISLRFAGGAVRRRRSRVASRRRRR